MKKVIIALLVIILIVGAGVGVYGFYMVNNLKEVTNIDLKEISSGEVELKDVELPPETKEWVEEKKTEAVAVVETIKKGDSTEIETKLEEVVTINPYLKSAFYVDTKGNLISTDNKKTSENSNVSNEEYFKQVMATKDLYISKPFLKDGALSVLLAYPVSDEKGEVIGVVGGTIPVTSLNQIKEQIGIK